jgi:hypothetical protein
MLGVEVCDVAPGKHSVRSATRFRRPGTAPRPNSVIPSEAALWPTRDLLFALLHVTNHRVSNRNTAELEFALTRSKQRVGLVSNRNFSRVPSSGFLAATGRKRRGGV